MENKAKKPTKEEFQSLSAFLTKYSFPCSTIAKTTNFKVEKQGEKAIFVKNSRFSYPRIKKGENVEEIKKELEILKKTSNLFEKMDIRTSVDVGDTFEPIYDITKVFGDEEKFSVEHKPGQVLLVDFWATWCGPCQGPMQHNQSMLEKNHSTWGDKVRIVGISVDDEKNSVVKRINEKNWKKIDHFFLGGWNDEHNAMQNYQFDGIPHVVLVDTNGKVTYIGSPHGVNLEENINRLLTTEPTEKKNQKDLKELKNTLSHQVTDLLNSPEYQLVQYDLSIEWKKEVSYNEIGEMIDFSHQKPKITFRFNIKHELSVRKIEESLYKLIPKENFEVNYTIDDPKGAFDFSIKTLKEELAKNGLQEAEIQFSKGKSYEYNGKAMFCEKTVTFTHQNIIKPTKFEQVEVFHNNISKILDSTDPLKAKLLRRFNLTCKLAKGDDFFPFEVEEVFSDEKIMLKHENNEVLLVDFWATWCGPCQGPMAKNQQMLEKNEEKWGEKVRICGVSLDQAKATVLNKVNEKNWTKVKHFFLGDNKKGINPYAIRGIPEIVLIDQKGVIVFKGHPSGVELEQEINRLLEGGNEVLKQEEQKDASIKEVALKPVSKEDLKKFGVLLKSPDFSKKVGEVVENMKYSANFVIEWNKKVIFDNEMQIKEVKITNPTVSLGLRKCDLPKFTSILSLIYETIDCDKIIEKKELIDSISIQFGLNCENCKKEMKRFEPQYYCHFCKLWYCEDCGEKVDEAKIGNEKLIHPHNMLYINISEEEGLEDIDLYKLGKNVTFDKNLQGFGACCNGCDGAVAGGYRFICVSCRPGPMRPGGFVDICHKCMGVLKKKTGENGKQFEEIEKRLSEEKHDGKSHLWLRICYGNNYYNY